MVGDANDAEVLKICRFITCSSEVVWEAMWKKISLQFAVHAIGESISGPNVPRGSRKTKVRHPPKSIGLDTLDLQEFLSGAQNRKEWLPGLDSN
jgi:hypothetical protein